MIESFEQKVGHNSSGVDIMPKADKFQMQAYEEFLKLYDHAEGFIDTLETLGDDAEQHIEAVEGLISSIEENTESIITYYAKYVKSGKKLNGVEKQKIESALASIKDALRKFKKAEEGLGYTFDYEI